MNAASPIIEAQGLTCVFTRRRGWWRRPTQVVAVDAVSFGVAPGEMFAIVGESGSGKSTVARCLTGLLVPSGGDVYWRGEPLRALRSTADRRAFHRRVQLVFQDTATALNPRLTVGACVREPLDVHHDGTPRDRDERVAGLLALVGLDPALAMRRPGDLSGGQRQRVVLARAMALTPELIVADEPVSSLDPSAQAQVVNLVLDLRATHGLTCVLVSHDLHLVGRVCQRVAVLWRGRLVEMGPLPRLFDAPVHPYTRRLLAARLGLDPAAAGVALPAVAVPDADARRPLVEVGLGHFAAVG